MSPLLNEHIEQLRKSGYEIEPTEDGQNRIFCVFGHYPIPKSIWDRDAVELLVIVPSAYPNAKLDMFWVYPKITLHGGVMPQAGDSEESYLGKQWQRFSWHPQAWNPAHDTLMTYLEVVNHRLNMRK